MPLDFLPSEMNNPIGLQLVSTIQAVIAKYLWFKAVDKYSKNSASDWKSALLSNVIFSKHELSALMIKTS